MNLNVSYFAQLKELANTDNESLSFEESSITPSIVWEMVRKKHQFPFDKKQLKPVVNDCFSEWEKELAEKDSLVFITPVSGG